MKNRSSHEFGTHKEVEASESVPEERGVSDDIVMSSEWSRVVLSVLSDVGWRLRWHSRTGEERSEEWCWAC